MGSSCFASGCAHEQCAIDGVCNSLNAPLERPFAWRRVEAVPPAFKRNHHVSDVILTRQFKSTYLCYLSLHLRETSTLVVGPLLLLLVICDLRPVLLSRSRSWGLRSKMKGAASWHLCSQVFRPVAELLGHDPKRWTLIWSVY